MKIDIGPYKNWVGPFQIAELIFFWATEKDEFGIMRQKEWVRKIGEFFAYGFTDDKETWFHKFLNWVDSKRERKIKIRIDPYDTWNMDGTLSLIIYPLLIQLKKDTHGAPFVDDNDVPEELKSTSAPAKENEWDTDDNYFKRWDYILDEMIWAFSQKLPDIDWMDQYTTGKCEFETKPFKLDWGSLKFDKEGIKKHEERMNNGFMLFGKYFQALWD